MHLFWEENENIRGKNQGKQSYGMNCSFIKLTSMYECFNNGIHLNNLIKSKKFCFDNIVRFFTCIESLWGPGWLNELMKYYCFFTYQTMYKMHAFKIAMHITFPCIYISGFKVWIFGLVERQSNTLLLFPVDSRDEKTLCGLIKSHVEPGTRIFQTVGQGT